MLIKIQNFWWIYKRNLFFISLYYYIQWSNSGILMRIHLLFCNWNTVKKWMLLAQRPVIEIGIRSRFISIDRWHRAWTGYRMCVHSKMVTIPFRRRSCPIDDSPAYLYIYDRIVSFIRMVTSCKDVPTDFVHLYTSRIHYLGKMKN